MQKRTIILSLLGTLLCGTMLYEAQGLSEKQNPPQNEYKASKIAFEQRELEYKKEIDNLKLLLIKEQSTVSQRNKQIELISKANTRLEKSQNELLTLEKTNEKIQESSKKITKQDKPDFSDTSKITNIDIDIINTMFEQGALKNNGKLLADIAIEHNINPYFFSAVIALESAYGKSKLAKNKHNFGGIKSSRNTYRAFSSKEEGLRYMASLLQRRYHNKGYISIAQIQRIYAPDWDGNKGWSRKVQTIMNRIYNKSLS